MTVPPKKVATTRRLAAQVHQEVAKSGRTRSVRPNSVRHISRVDDNRECPYAGSVAKPVNYPEGTPTGSCPDGPALIYTSARR